MKYALHRHGSQQGFSLVETLVAITVLLVAIVGPMTIAARGLQSAFYAREQVIAFSLAQEGLELIRALRDENALGGRAWHSGFSVCDNPHGCGLDARGSSARNCQSRSNCALNYDAGALSGARGFYTYAAGDATPFTRVIRVGRNGDEAEVIVEVSWQSGLFGGARSVVLQSRVFNQYDDI